jgi:hypothetical protein
MPRAKWHPLRDEQLVRMHHAGVGVQEIATRIKRPTLYVKQRMTELEAEGLLDDHALSWVCRELHRLNCELDELERAIDAAPAEAR